MSHSSATFSLKLFLLRGATQVIFLQPRSWIPSNRIQKQRLKHLSVFHVTRSVRNPMAPSRKKAVLVRQNVCTHKYGIRTTNRSKYENLDISKIFVRNLILKKPSPPHREVSSWSHGHPPPPHSWWGVINFLFSHHETMSSTHGGGGGGDDNSDWFFGVESRLHCDCKASLAELLRILVADGGGFNWTFGWNFRGEK